MNGFEGYTGIEVAGRQLTDDVIFALLSTLFIAFGIVFRANYHLFLKMVRDIFQVKDRQSLFESVSGNESAFRAFMIFQFLLLCSVYIYIMGQTYGYIPGYPTIKGNLAAIGIILALTFGFYVLKQLMYNACGYIFAASGLYKAWYSGYSASAGLFGAAMYIPVISAAYTSVDSRMTLYAAVALYAMWRMIIAYRTIIVFNIRGVGFLYIILYLCAQEILPLVLIYEGVIYLYNLY